MLLLKTQLEINIRGVVASRAYCHSHCYTEPAVNLKGKEGQLQHKIQVSVFNCASLTLFKDQKWAYKSEESHDRSQSSLNELITPCLDEEQKARDKENKGWTMDQPALLHVRQCPENRTCWLGQPVTEFQKGEK